MDVLPAYTAAAAASVAAILDLRSRRIPNWLTATALLAGVLLNGMLSGLEGAVASVLGAAVGLAMLLPFYAMRAIGAGDVKLLAALGALLGASLLVSVAIYGALVGGAISIVILLVRRRLFINLQEMFIEHRPPTLSGATAPYGVAIASGVYMALVLPAVIG
jgi:prepilin peptidase CpaA